MGLIEEISEFLQKGRSKKIKELVQKALDENMDSKVILNEGLLSGMMIVGAKFKNNEVFVPDCTGRPARYRKEPGRHDVQGSRIRGL